MKKKRLYIHIGTHKTGTTSLQNFLFANRKKLADAGVSYPEIGIDEGAQHVLGGNLVKGLGLSVFGHTKPKRSNIAEFPLWKELASHLVTTPMKSVLVSTEEFEWLSRPEVIRNYLFDIDVKIVIYLRRQDKYLESLYQTFVKGPRHLAQPFPAWLNKAMSVWKIHDYFSLLSRWADIFGRENLIVRIFEKEVQSGLERGFLSLIGISSELADLFEIPPKTWDQARRETIDVRCLEVIRLGNQMDIPRSRRENLLRTLVDLSKNLEAAGRIEKQLSTLQERESIMSAVARSNQLVFREYFGSSSDLFSS